MRESGNWSARTFGRNLGGLILYFGVVSLVPAVVLAWQAWSDTGADALTKAIIASAVFVLSAILIGMGGIVAMLGILAPPETHHVEENRSNVPGDLTTRSSRPLGLREPRGG